MNIVFDEKALEKVYSRRYRLYSRISDHETVLELWASSSRHPDSEYYYSKYVKSEYYPSTGQIVAWMYECASNLAHVFHSVELAEYATEMFRNYIDTLNRLDKIGYDINEHVSVFNKY